MTTGTSIAATSTITSRTVRDALVQGHVSTVRRWLRAGQVCARTWRDRQQGGMDAHDNVRMNRSGDDDASREDTTGWPLLFFAVRYGYDALLLELLEMERREDHDEHDEHDVQASAALSSKECPSQATRQAQHEQPQPRRSSPFAFLDRRNATLLQQQQQQLPLTPRTSPPPLPSAHLTPALPSAAASSSPTMHHAGPAMNFPFHHARVVLSPPTPTHSRVPSGDTSPEPSSTTLPAVSPSPPTTIIQDARGRTALMLAVLYDNLKAVDWLLMFHRAEIDVREEERGETALHMAARKGHDDVMERLLDSGADINAQDQLGNTPLHLACAYGHRDSIQLLIERDCRFALPNHEGWTALDYSLTTATASYLQDCARLAYEGKRLMQKRMSRRQHGQQRRSGPVLGVVVGGSGSGEE